jgi:hypothetical protein
MKGMDHRKIADLLIEHVRKQGFFVTSQEPSSDVRMANAKVARVVVRPGAYNGSRTPMDLPISQELIGVVEVHVDRWSSYQLWVEPSPLR